MIRTEKTLLNGKTVVYLQPQSEADVRELRQRNIGPTDNYADQPGAVNIHVKRAGDAIVNRPPTLRR